VIFLGNWRLWFVHKRKNAATAYRNSYYFRDVAGNDLYPHHCTMSYNVTILRKDIPADNDAAWTHCDQLLRQETGEQAPDFLDLVEQFKQRFPCICDLPDDLVDDGVWSDGPLSNNAGKNVTTVGMVYSKVDIALPELIRIAVTNGFVVFDFQSGDIYRPW
jgi:hypothetical protein